MGRGYPLPIPNPLGAFGASIEIPLPYPVSPSDLGVLAETLVVNSTEMQEPISEAMLRKYLYQTMVTRTLWTKKIQ